MASKPLILKRKPPTRIVRKHTRGQMPLELKPRVRLATRRKRARLIGVAIALISAVAFTFGASALSYHDRFAINDINVVGTQALSAAAVESAFGSNVNDGVRHFFSRTNIFFYPQTELREALLRELPLVRSVSFNRESLLSQAVTISVKEREPAFLWCSSECFFMDAGGFIFMKATDPGNFFTFKGGLIPHRDPIGQIFMRGRLDALVILVRDLKNSGLVPVNITIENEEDVTFLFENGLVVKASNTSRAEDIRKNLNLVMESDVFTEKKDSIEYIDLRFGNRVYYKLK